MNTHTLPKVIINFIGCKCVLIKKNMSKNKIKLSQVLCTETRRCLEGISDISKLPPLQVQTYRAFESPAIEGLLGKWFPRIPFTGLSHPNSQSPLYTVHCPDYCLQWQQMSTLYTCCCFMGTQNAKVMGSEKLPFTFQRKAWKIRQGRGAPEKEMHEAV